MGGALKVVFLRKDDYWCPWNRSFSPPLLHAIYFRFQLATVQKCSRKNSLEQLWMNSCVSYSFIIYFFFLSFCLFMDHISCGLVKKEKKNGCGELFTSVCQNRFPTRPSAPPGLLLFIVALNQQEKKISFTQSKWDSPSHQFFFFIHHTCWRRRAVRQRSLGDRHTQTKEKRKKKKK